MTRAARTVKGAVAPGVAGAAPVPVPATRPASSLLDRVRALAPLVTTRAEETERDRAVPADVLQQLKAAGCFRMYLPRRCGGEEATLSEGLQVMEELSRADAATGWTVMIGATTVQVFSFLPADTFASIYADNPDVIGAGVLAPKGRAVAVEGGYRVTGQWPFASGSKHASWIAAHCIVVRDGQSNLLPNGMPETRLAVFPAGEVEILDTWDVSGLRGTGSYDIRLEDAFCPEGMTGQVFGAKPTITGTLFEIPVIAQLGLFTSVVAVGIAQGAIDDVAALAAGGKRPAFGGSKRLAESTHFQERLGEAEAQLRAARALLYAEADRAWRMAASGEPYSLLDRARLRTTGAQVVALAGQAVDACYNLGGGTSIYQSSPLQRRFRDFHALTQHAGASREFYSFVGALLAGEEVASTRL